MASTPPAAPGLNAPVFVPSAPPGLSSPTVPANKPLPPGGTSASSVHAKPFVPSGGGALPKSGSATALASGAVNAPVFVPGGSSSSSGSKAPAIDAKAFVPGGGSGSTQASRQPAAGAPAAPAGSGPKPPKPSPTRYGRGGSRPQSQSGGRPGTPELPEGDDLLGMSAVTPGDAKDVATQAAEMFKSLNPFAPQQQQGEQLGQAQQQQGLQAPGGASRGRSSASGSSSTRASPRPAPSQGLGPPPPGFGPTTAAASTVASSAAGTGASAPPSAASASSSGGRDWAGGSAGPRGGGAGRGNRAGRGRRPGSGRGVAGHPAAPSRAPKAGLFMSEQLRSELQQRSYLAQAQVDPEAAAELGVPAMVAGYHTLYPLEDVAAAAEASSQALGVTSQVAKAVSSLDGQAYALRRIDGRQVLPSAELLGQAEAAVGRWEAVASHPNLVALRDAFVSNEWDGSASLHFVHDYHPGAYTLEQAHLLPTQTAQGLVRNPASEELLWSYLVQLTAALRCIHQAGLAARPACLMPSKVLVSSSGRVRIGSLGVPEVLQDAAGFQDLPQLQRDDLAALGNLLLLLACLGRGVPPSLDYLTAHFSREFCHVVAGLLASAEGSGFASWRSLLSALGDRVVDELDGAAAYSDGLMGELQREADNGRLLRLLGKLCFICERPELAGDTQWAETGDRYLLKLFRDLLFHQSDEEGAPLMDWGLVAEALNKVDAGVPEKVLLMSRDELAMLVVSYADVRRCIASCYEELRSRASGQYGAAVSQQQGGAGMPRTRSRPSMQY